MTDFTIISKFRNKDQCEKLVFELEKRGKTCYNFCAKPADPKNPDSSPEEQMKVFESVDSFFDKEYFQKVFETDLAGLKNAEKVIELLTSLSKEYKAALLIVTHDNRIKERFINKITLI